MKCQIKSLLASRFLRIAAFSFLLLFLIGANLVALPLYPPPSCNKASNSSVAVSFLEQGKFGWSSFVVGDYLGRDVNLLRQGRLYTLGLAVTFWIFGATLTARRIYSAVGWPVAGGITYFIGEKFYSRIVGVLAMLAFLTSYKHFLPRIPSDLKRG